MLSKDQEQDQEREKVLIKMKCEIKPRIRNGLDGEDNDGESYEHPRLLDRFFVVIELVHTS